MMMLLLTTIMAMMPVVLVVVKIATVHHCNLPSVDLTCPSVFPQSQQANANSTDRRIIPTWLVSS
jgi:hypothetical protein